jgi:hypothetical protein
MEPSRTAQVAGAVLTLAAAALLALVAVDMLRGGPPPAGDGDSGD